MKTFSFFKGVSLLLALNLLIKPVWIFFIDRRVQVMVGHEAYGQYFALLNLTIIMLFLADAGISNLLNQRLAAGAGIHFWQLLRTKILMLLAFVVTVFLVAFISGVKQWTLLGYIVAVQVAGSLFLFLRAIISARQQFSTDAALSVLDKTLMIVLCAGFLYGLFRSINIILFLQLQLLATVTAIVAALFFIVKKQMLHGMPDAKVPRLLMQLFPFALIILLMSVQGRLDGFLLLRLAPEGALQAGLYAGAYRLLDAANMIGYLTASFLLPFAARHQSNTDLLNDTASVMAQFLLSVAALCIAFILFHADWLQQILYHSSRSDLSRLLLLLMMALPAYYIMHVYGTLFTARARFRPFIIVLLVAVFINAFLNVLLIPSQGAAGAAWASIASQYSGALAVYAVYKRSWKHVTRSEWLRPLLVFISGLLFFALAAYLELSALWAGLLSFALFSVYLISQIDYFRKNFSAHA